MRWILILNDRMISRSYWTVVIGSFIIDLSRLCHSIIDSWSSLRSSKTGGDAKNI
ncbi:hypothetical protein QJS10_CPA09g00439 [Acorus calamus]|uniref:Uncharacterized protein n=1 Tax=Acorus calamus TaxID=4465 RepID=A0AAV9E6C1_ACOCL|nr:hypothetical protein QJS10_CPA09g00439 [Acorus calamus]